MKWNTPVPPRPSGSTMVRAKLLVPAGTPDQESCGDMFSPTQLGLPAVLFATFFGIICPSLKVVEVRAKGSAAEAPPFQAKARARAATADRLLQTTERDMAVLPLRPWSRTPAGRVICLPGSAGRPGPFAAKCSTRRGGPARGQRPAAGPARRRPKAP